MIRNMLIKIKENWKVYLLFLLWLLSVGSFSILLVATIIYIVGG